MDSTIVKIVYEKLYAHYGDLNWWPAGNPYEVMVGAVLTQNTAWSNVEKAIANFDNRLSPEFIETIPVDELCVIIKPAGFFNQKSRYLKALTAWFKKYNYSVEEAKQHELSFLRKELLEVKGIGHETADSILLYALDLPTFVIDKYTQRLLQRLGSDTAVNYHSAKAFFESNIQAAWASNWQAERPAPTKLYIYNNFHALIVINAKEHCKTKPVCDGCPLNILCKKTNI